MYRRPKCWICRDPEEAVSAIRRLRRTPDLESKTRQWLGQAIKRVRVHLDTTDYSQSKFLASINVKGLCPLVIVSLCDDGEILVEYLVLCDDGSLVSRHEALDLIPELPTPEVIAQRCHEIRVRKPLSGYNDQWVGFDGPGIRSY